jgi:ABC-type nitrate/sulfonate/bicarbonate transport system permease component
VRRGWRNPWLLRGLSLAAVLLAWEILGARVNPIFLSTPSRIARAGMELMADGELSMALAVSLGVVAAGFFSAVAVAIPVGLAMGRSRVVEYLIDPYVSALYVIPRIALIPLIIIWFGLGIGAQVVVVFGTTVFPVLLSTYAGVRNVNVQLVETAQAFGASETQVFRMVILPACVPFIMSGLRLGVGQAIIGMVVAQMFLGMAGLGYMLVNFGNQFATSHVFVVVLALAALGVALTEVVKLAERRFSHWRGDATIPVRV